MKYEIFVGDINKYKTYYDTNFDGRVVFIKQKKYIRDANDPSVIIKSFDEWYYISNRYRSECVHKVDETSSFQAWVKPFIKLEDTPEDYKIGDKFKIQGVKSTWRYLGENLGICEEYFGPCTIKDINDNMFLEVNCAV